MVWKVRVTGWFIIQRHREEKKVFVYLNKDLLFFKKIPPREPFAILKYLIYRSTSDGKYMEEKRLP